MVREDVPRLLRRTGDTVLANQNNATLLLGRDRLHGVETGYGSSDASGGGVGAGSAHLVVGRTGEDPSPSDDAATIYISAKSDPDTLAGTDLIGQTSSAASTSFMRADCVRITPRKDIKVSVGKAYLLMQSDGKIIVEGDISLGEGAADRIIKGDSFKPFFGAHVHPTPTGVSGPPTNPMTDDLLSPRNKVK